VIRYDRLIRIADRLARVKVGSAAADAAIHEAVGQAGLVRPYTIDEAAARTLLPLGFEWMAITPAAKWVYAPCRRAGRGADGMLHPHHGQWGRTLPLSMCGAAMRTWPDHHEQWCTMRLLAICDAVMRAWERGD
jgi:hypothetical protein